MANTLTGAIDAILNNRALDVLREQSIMPRLVNRDIADVSGVKGQTVTIAVADSNNSARDVTAGRTGTNITVVATTKTVTLNQWRETGHDITDKEFEEIMEGYLPAQAEEDLRALVNDVDQKIHDELRKKTYQWAGTAGTTPFATNLGVFKTTRAKLSTSLAPLDNRRVVLDPDAEGNALILGNFLQAEQRGDQGGVISGVIGHKLGADWMMSQNVRTHTSGSISKVTSVLTNGSVIAGLATLVLDRASFTGTLLTGDLFSVGSQQFVVTATVTAASSAITVGVSPVLSAAIADGQAVTFASKSVSDTWVDNLHFHKDALAFASRPLTRSAQAGLGSTFGTIVDPVSGLAIRAEISRQHRQTSFRWDILFGMTTVRPELSSRILG